MKLRAVLIRIYAVSLFCVLPWTSSISVERGCLLGSVDTDVGLNTDNQGRANKNSHKSTHCSDIVPKLTGTGYVENDVDESDTSFDGLEEEEINNQTRGDILSTLHSLSQQLTSLRVTLSIFKVNINSFILYLERNSISNNMKV